MNSARCTACDTSRQPLSIALTSNVPILPPLLRLDWLPNPPSPLHTPIIHRQPNPIRSTLPINLTPWIPLHLLLVLFLLRFRLLRLSICERVERCGQGHNEWCGVGIGRSWIRRGFNKWFEEGSVRGKLIFWNKLNEDECLYYRLSLESTWKKKAIYLLVIRERQSQPRP